MVIGARPRETGVVDVRGSHSRVGRGGWAHRGLALVTAVVSTLAVGVVTTPPAAAATANDTWRDAERIRVGDTVRQNTTRATKERLDRRVNRSCGAPRVKASVWFTYRSATTKRLLLDAAASDYSVGLMVFRGRPSPSSLVTCSPGQAGFRARADRRYFVMAFSDGRADGGRLVLNLTKAPRPTLELTLDDTAVLDESGTITVTGTVRCTGATFVGVDATLRQLVGRFYVIGYSFSEGSCDGAEQDLTLPIPSDNGIFGEEPATVDVAAYACGPFDCADVVIEDHPLTVQRAATVPPRRRGGS